MSLSMRSRPSIPIVLLYMFALVLSYGSAVIWLQMVPLLLACILIVIYRDCLTGLESSDKLIFIILIISIALPFPVVLLNNVSTVYYFPLEVLMLLVALIFTRNSDSYVLGLKYTLIFIQAIIIIFLFKEGLESFPLDRLVPDASANGVTSYLVLLQASYCLALYTRNNKVPLITSSLTLGIAIVGWGRGSVIAAIALLAINLYYTSINFRAKFQKVLKYVAVVIVAFLGWFYQSEVEEFFVVNTKLGGGIYDDSRASIIRDYFESIDAFSLIFGANYAGTSIETEYRGNPHNSYIRAHHTFGILYLFVILGLPFIAMVLRGGRVKRYIYPMLMIIIIWFRAFTEPIVFPTLMDIFYFASVFVMIQGLRVDRSSINEK